MFKIGLSSCSKPLTSATFAAYAKNGIENMEIVYRDSSADKLDFDEIRKMADEHGVSLWSLHLPFHTDIDISNPLYSEKTVALNSEIIRKAAGIGVKLFVIHPSAEPIDDSERAVRTELSKKSLVRLADVAEECGAVLAVENLPRTCLGKNVEEMLDLTNADERLRVCFDTNHLLAGDPVDFIEKLAPRIVTTHVSDYDFINERHWLPGEGKLDWQAIISALEKIGYKGPWLYEIAFENPNTIQRPRDLTCEDFRRNANELFSGKAPTVISTPVPNLGMW